MNIFDPSTRTLLVGDLNVCSVSKEPHPILDLLNLLSFKHNLKQPSHSDGNVIDYASHYCPADSIEVLDIKQYGQYFTDHDMILVNIDDFL